MNINTYDNVTEIIDKNRTWVDVKKKTLLSREIKHRPYFLLLKRYDAASNTNNYYIGMFSKPPEGRSCKETRIDNYGRIKIRLSSIWKGTYLEQLDKDCNIIVNLVESDADADVYLLDV